MLFDLDGHHAHDVVVEAHQAFHLCNRCGRRIGTQKGIMALAVFVDFESHGAETPVFERRDVAAIVLENLRKVLDEACALEIS